MNGRKLDHTQCVKLLIKNGCTLEVLQLNPPRAMMDCRRAKLGIKMLGRMDFVKKSMNVLR